MGDVMKKIKFKFTLSLLFLLLTVVFILFFDENSAYLLNNLFLLLFIYFLIDSLLVIIPSINKYIPAMKHFSIFHNEYPQYSEEKLIENVKHNNIKAIYTFFLYFGLLTLIGIFYLSYDFFEEIHIYLLFLVINVFDYFRVLIWCPFKSIIFKNSCCYTCRITNWDRFMKFYILIFIPTPFTITLVILGLLIFLIWEYDHQIHPQRFYSISN